MRRKLTARVVLFTTGNISHEVYLHKTQNGDEINNPPQMDWNFRPRIKENKIGKQAGCDRKYILFEKIGPNWIISSL